jgi:protein-tyrosine phosphatase
MEYLDGVLDSILASYGTVEMYLMQACGIDEDSIKNLKELLLQ